MKLDPIADVIAAEPIGAGVTIHKRSPAPPPTKEELKALPRNAPPPSPTSREWPACGPQPKKPRQWFHRQGTFALSIGAYPCPNKRCFGSTEGGG